MFHDFTGAFVSCSASSSETFTRHQETARHIESVNLMLGNVDLVGVPEPSVFDDVWRQIQAGVPLYCKSGGTGYHGSTKHRHAWCLFEAARRRLCGFA